MSIPIHQPGKLLPRVGAISGIVELNGIEIIRHHDTVAPKVVAAVCKGLRNSFPERRIDPGSDFGQLHGDDADPQSAAWGLRA